MPRGRPEPYAYVCGHCEHLTTHHLLRLPDNEEPFVCEECDCQIAARDPRQYGITQYIYERKYQ